MTDITELTEEQLEALKARLKAVLDDCPGDLPMQRLMELYMLTFDIHPSGEAPSVAGSFAAALQRLGAERYKVDVHLRYATHTDVFNGDGKLDRHISKPEGVAH